MSCNCLFLGGYVGYGDRMSWRGLVAVIAVVVFGAACSDSTQPSPATAPSTVAAPTTVAPTSTVATTVPTSTTTPAPTPTPEEARLAEIEAIFRDLEFRRLEALYRNDEEAFRALFANEAYLEQSLQALGALEFLFEPQLEDVADAILEVLVDAPDCLAAQIAFDSSAVLGPDAIGQIVRVLEPLQEEPWGFSFAGDGWLCDGQHPLE